MTDYFSDATDYTTTSTTFVSKNSRTMTAALNSVTLTVDAEGGGDTWVYGAAGANFIDSNSYGRSVNVVYEAASFTIVTAGYYKLTSHNTRVTSGSAGWDFYIYYSVNAPYYQWNVGDIYDGAYSLMAFYDFSRDLGHLNVGDVVRWFCERNVQTVSGDFEPKLYQENESIVGYTKNSTNAADVVTIGSDWTGSYVTKTLNIGNLAINDVIRFWMKSSGSTSHMKNTKITAAYGYITFNTIPTLAEIYLDGSGTSSGPTNITLSYIAAGNHNYLLKKARYSDVGGSVMVTDGGTTTVTKTLTSTDSNFLQMF